MKNKLIFASVLSAFALTGIVSAQVAGSGTLGVTAQVQGSILVTFSTDASGLTVTNTGTSAAALPMGTVQMYGGTVPTNVTKSLTSTTSFTLSTPFDIRVDLANSTSDNFSMAATLSTTDAVNTWTIGTTTITSAASPTPFVTTGTYATALPFTLNLTVPSSAAAGSISNTLNFAATAN